MRILVVGVGATGGYFGARLAEAGRDVTFLARPARAAALRENGLQIVSPLGDVTLRPAIVTAAELDGSYDVVLLGVKAFALEAAIADVAPAVGEDTAILPMLNGMRHLDVLSARFGERRVLGGVCLIASTLDDAGRIVQLNELGELIYGERDGSASPRIAAIDATLQGAGFGARATSDVMGEMWRKWVMLSALGAITCLLRGTIGEVAATRGGTDLALSILGECASVAAAAGYPPDDAFRARIAGMLTARDSPLASSMYRDLQRGRPVEVDQILGDLLARARDFGQETPLVSAAFAQLSIYSRTR